MSMMQHLWLALSSLVFVLWAYMMFRTLFRMSRAARAKAAARGYSWPSISEQLQEFVLFATAPEHRQTRWQLIGLTLTLWAVQWSGHALWPLGGE
ncbi:hypothetical protein O4H61_06220 [Roseovarius aestuarii]|nr:hypothetical protein [Roseovarius aestuarii]